jgi:hypothetical protein
VTFTTKTNQTTTLASLRISIKLQVHFLSQPPVNGSSLSPVPESSAAFTGPRSTFVVCCMHPANKRKWLPCSTPAPKHISTPLAILLLRYCAHRTWQSALVVTLLRAPRQRWNCSTNLIDTGRRRKGWRTPQLCSLKLAKADGQ